MSEPTYHLRPDVEVQLDMLVTRLRAALQQEYGETPHLVLRDALADAWHRGWMRGYDDTDLRGPTSPNPYHYLEDK